MNFGQRFTGVYRIFERHDPKILVCVVLCSTLLSSKLGGQISRLGRTSTKDLKLILTSVNG